MDPGSGAEDLVRSLPPEARRLLADHVHSAGDLDLLMLLDADRARAWSVEEICDALRCPPGWAAEHLTAMAHAGLVVERDGRYACHPASRQLEEAVGALAGAHETRWAELARLVAVPQRRRRRTLTERSRRD